MAFERSGQWFFHDRSGQWFFHDPVYRAMHPHGPYATEQEANEAEQALNKEDDELASLLVPVPE